MSLVEYQESYIFNSATNSGAVNKSVDGSTFTVNFNTPLSIPREAVAATVELIGARIWYNTANISASLGSNQFRYIIAGVPKVFPIPDGLYTLAGLNDLISRELVIAGFAANAIVLTGDSATQKSVFTFNTLASQVDLVLTDTPFELLGFTNRLVPLAPSTIVGQSEVGDTVANFNLVAFCVRFYIAI